MFQKASGNGGFFIFQTDINSARLQLSHKFRTNISSGFQMRLVTLFLLNFLACSAQAEVADKCASFVSSFNNEEYFGFLDADEAVIRLLLFSSVYTALATGIFFLIKYLKIQWFKFIPFVFTILVAIYIASELLPQQEPCSLYYLRNEMPPALIRIQMLFYFMLFVVPLILSLILRRFFKRKVPKSD